MLMGDILTIKQYELPIKLMIFNNSCLGMVKLEMQVAGLPNSGTDYKPVVNYARIAEAAGILGVRIEDPAGSPRPADRGQELYNDRCCGHGSDGL
jgi:pyruvate dehydrogenase (quinone)